MRLEYLPANKGSDIEKEAISEIWRSSLHNFLSVLILFRQRESEYKATILR